MLSDGGRLCDGDDQIAAYLSPKGDAVAYWIYTNEGTPRLAIQSLDTVPLRVKGMSLTHELEKNRRQHLQEQRE